MNTYHVCYDTDGRGAILSSKNLDAESYGAAEAKFKELYGDFKIIYIKQVEAQPSFKQAA